MTRYDYDKCIHPGCAKKASGSESKCVDHLPPKKCMFRGCTGLVKSRIRKAVYCNNHRLVRKPSFAEEWVEVS